ncbi:MAG: hypothetical protein HYU29_08150 [Chloroflexi bacterium]|nr:hypothetical protein [Chloroflexota bacterium]
MGRSSRNVLGGLILLSALLLACARAAPTATPTKAPIPPTATPTRAVAPATATPTRAPVVVATPTPVTVPATPTATARPAPRGVLNAAVENLGSENWALRVVTGDEQVIMGHVFELLIGFEPATGTFPASGLAEKWSVADTPGGGAKWSFTLRKGVQFHQGQGELTAEDFKFSVNEFFKPQSVNPDSATNLRWIGKDINNIKIIDKYTFEVNSPEKLVIMIRRLSFARLGIGLSPTSKKYVETVGEEVATRRPVGTGPFEFVDHKRNQSVTLKARTEHWRKVPNVAEVNIFVVPEVATRLALVRTKGVDITPIPARFKAEVEAGNLKIFRGEMATDLFGIFGGMVLPSRPGYKADLPWTGPEPTNEKPRLVRQAMNLAIDREAILKKILLNEGFLMGVTFNFQKEGVAWWNPEWKVYPYDPKKAKELLTQAGYPNGFDTNMWVIKLAYSPENVDASEAVASYWEQNLGLKVKRELTEYRPSVRQKLVERTTAGWTYLYTNPGVTDPIDYACSVNTSYATVTHTEHPVTDDLCNKAYNELDAAKRVDLIRQMGNFWYNQYWTVPLANGNILYATSEKVVNYPVFPQRSVVLNLEYVTIK